MLNKSFTLIEVIVAIFLITAGIVGVFALVQQITILTSFSSSKLEASYLSQEGIEIVRNIRDSNWLERKVWDEGLDSTNWEAVNFLDGSQSKFERRVTITPQGADILKVLVEVRWQEKGREHSISAQENLYNWK